jgi:hypothetical protein
VSEHFGVVEIEVLLVFQEVAVGGDLSFQLDLEV